MLGRVLVNMIIIPAVILTLSNGIVNKSFANEEKNKTEYVISQSEESKFLEDIYKTETDSLKIKKNGRKPLIIILLNDTPQSFYYYRFSTNNSLIKY